MTALHAVRRISARRSDLQCRTDVDTRLISSNAVFTAGAFVRHDQYNYYPSDNPFADLGPTDLQRETVSQLRFLTNAGARATLSYVKGIHNIKAGVTYEQTFLTENDHLGIVDPTFNAPCLDATPACSVEAGFTDPAQCAAGDRANMASNPNSPATRPATLLQSDLLPYDLTRGGLYFFRGHTDVKELALYVQDTITKGTGLSISAFAETCTTASPSPPGGTSARHRLQHQAEQHSPSRFLRANSGNSVQREPGAFQHRMQRLRF